MEAAGNLESEETARNYPIQNAVGSEYSIAAKKMGTGPPPGMVSAVDRVNLTQIENAIDCLLA